MNCCIHGDKHFDDRIKIWLFLRIQWCLCVCVCEMVRSETSSEPRWKLVIELESSRLASAICVANMQMCKLSNLSKQTTLWQAGSQPVCLSPKSRHLFPWRVNSRGRNCSHRVSDQPNRCSLLRSKMAGIRDPVARRNMHILFTSSRKSKMIHSKHRLAVQLAAVHCSSRLAFRHFSFSHPLTSKPPLFKTTPQRMLRTAFFLSLWPTICHLGSEPFFGNIA